MPKTLFAGRLVRLAGVLLAAGLARGSGPAHAAEVCRYAGTGDYHADIAVTTIAERQGLDTQVRVLWDLAARAMLVFHVRYRVEEVSAWHDGVLQIVGLNVRTFVNGRIIKQQWDLFQRNATGFAAWRMQAKTARDFAARYGTFAPHWDMATFGAPWLDDYRRAPAERRPDLDLLAGEAPPDLVPPLAEAFYNVRHAQMRAQRVSLFLPGNKKQRRADIALAAPSAATFGAHVWHVSLDSERLGLIPGSTAALTVLQDGALQTIEFAIATAHHAAQGSIHGEGCSGRAESAGTPMPVSVDPRR